MRKLITMRPRTIGPDVHLEARTIHEGIEALARMFGLLVVNSRTDHDEHGTEYFEVTLGNGSRWTAYEAIDVQWVQKPA